MTVGWLKRLSPMGGRCPHPPDPEPGAVVGEGAVIVVDFGDRRGSVKRGSNFADRGIWVSVM